VIKDAELKFLRSHELGRLATASSDATPHVIPVVYALDEDAGPVIATDYRTKKLADLKENPKVSFVVDEYNPNRAVVIQGTCQILERGQEYLRLLGILFDRFEFYRKHPWGEGESPILKISIKKTISWGL